jgi:hypothetical protein
MTTLHIEHAIKDLELWREAFGRAAPLREQHGVRGYDIRHPVDDQHFLVIDLAFDTVSAAEGFLVELHEIWQTPAASPALAGTPQIRILETIESTRPSPPYAAATGAGHDTTAVS